MTRHDHSIDDKQARMLAQSRREAGFTLLEVMVVLIIIGLLAGIVGVAVIGRVEDARIQTAQTQIANLKSALDLYRLDNGFYPDTEQTLQVLVAPPTSGRIPMRWKPGGYLNSNFLPLDPWQMDYLYLNQGGMAVVFSAGADGVPNTEDDVFGQ
ncbi:MAG: type II secretion system major pseudopilin GspG [Candidatus Alcyoniella australis]|nr:type II secretion system major pseudopilin GspG [Candidatus Alcyoniella australis]